MEHTPKLSLVLIMFITLVIACSEDEGFLGPAVDDGGETAVEDTGNLRTDVAVQPDASADVSILDVNVPDDSGIDAGPGETHDVGSDSGPDLGMDMRTDDAGEDAGVDQGASPCDGLAIGQTCSGEDCPSPYSCVDGRCVPVPGAERPDCGGFVGATCTTRTFPTCTYFTGADYGPCLTTAEEMCACTEHTDLFQCFGL